MKAGLIGYTGFVGSNLTTKFEFTHLYNSKNIEEITSESFDILICAGAPAVKWKANQNPEEDMTTLTRLMNCLQSVQAKQFVLISTVDVYSIPKAVTEETVITPEKTDPYGKHRFYLEQFVRGHFQEAYIIRLPGLFGPGLKKNFIYDLIHDNCLHLTHKDSKFQFYYLDRIWVDIQTVLRNRINTMNFATEPVIAQEIVEECFGMEFNNLTEKAPVDYNMKTKYDKLFGGENGYIYNKKQIMEQLKQFVHNENRSL